MREGRGSEGEVAYEAPRLFELGTLAELTLATGHCTEKLSGHSDGLHFSSHHIVCTSH
jgi:hypothetical protein